GVPHSVRPVVLAVEIAPRDGDVRERLMRSAGRVDLVVVGVDERLTDIDPELALVVDAVAVRVVEHLLADRPGDDRVERVARVVPCAAWALGLTQNGRDVCWGP